MITIKETGSQLNNINKNIIKQLIENKWIIAFIERPLNYNKILKKSHYKELPTGEYFKEYIDDITPQEIQAGTLAVFNYCKINNCLNLYYDYILAISNTDDEKLNALKEKKKYEINVSRDLSILQGFNFNGKLYQTDENSLTYIANTAQTDRTDIKWISKDNSIISFTNEDFKQFHSDITKFIQDNVIKARELKNQVILAKNIEDLDKIKW